MQLLFSFPLHFILAFQNQYKCIVIFVKAFDILYLGKEIKIMQTKEERESITSIYTSIDCNFKRHFHLKKHFIYFRVFLFYLLKPSIDWIKIGSFVNNKK